jgi:radical SAM protein with 4Fe4S-binding SPASM domain
MTRSKGMMTEDTYNRILSELRSFKPELTLHLAGESFLHKKLFEYIKYAKRAGFQVGITTNGTLLDIENFGILETGIDNINISLAGVDADDYRFIRNMGDYEEIKKNIIALAKKKTERKLNLKIYVNVTLTKHNRDRIKHFKKQFKSIEGIDGVIIRDLMHWGGGVDIKGLNLYYDGIRQTFSWIVLSNIFFYSLYRLLVLHNSWNELKHRVWCGDIISSVGFLWDGSVVPCCLDYNGSLILGNINETSFNNIWNGEKMEKLRVLLKSKRSIMNHPVCGPCKFKQF